MFYRLIVNCDDFGRFEGRTAILKGRLFPLKGDVTFGMIEEGLRKLNSVGLVEMYEYDGKPYLYIPTWENHQTVRAATSKYPDPKECESICIQLQTDESSCKQMDADENGCKQIHPYSYSNNDIRNSVFDNVQAQDSENGTDEEQTTESKRKPNKQTDTRFNIFWEQYPKKQNKIGSEKAFIALKASDELFDEIMDGLARWKASEQWQNPKYIPVASKFIHERRWEDEDIPQAKSSDGMDNLRSLYAQFEGQ